MDEEKPNTSHLVLKPKEIVPTDKRSVPGDGTAISVQLMHRENQLADEKAARRKKGAFLRPVARNEPAPPPGFKRKEITPLDPPSSPDDGSAISVPEILRENRIADERSGWGRIRRFGRRKSRRTRDFLVFVGGTDLVIVILMRTLPSFVSLVYGVAALTLVTTMFGWIMFFVMDDY
jgi:hypothetical protein